MARTTPGPDDLLYGTNDSPYFRGDLWLNDSGLFDLETRFSFNEGTGWFEALVPVVADMGIVAVASGWRPSCAMLPRFSDGGGPLEISLELLPAIRVSGRVTTNEGPLQTQILITAYTSAHLGAGGSQEVWLRRGGFTMSKKPNLPMQATFRARARTEPDGRFSIEVKDEGETVLVVWEPGYSPLFLPVGSMSSSVAELGLELRPPEQRGGVTMRLHGKSLANHQVFLSDLTRRDIQPAVQVSTDSQGRLRAEWFARGREYGLGFDGPQAKDLQDRFLVWSGQTEIELAELPLATDVLSR